LIRDSYQGYEIKIVRVLTDMAGGVLRASGWLGLDVAAPVPQDCRLRLPTVYPINVENGPCHAGLHVLVLHNQGPLECEQ